MSWQKMKSANLQPEIVNGFAVENNGNVLIFGGPVSKQNQHIGLFTYNIGITVSVHLT